MNTRIIKYIYKNEKRIDAVEVVRTEEGNDKKIHREYILEKEECENLLPYRFDKFEYSNDPIYLVEGEKCVEVMIERGLVATTTIGGANSWKKDYAQYFKGREVIIIPDNDGSGKKYAEAAYRDISLVAKDCTILSLGLTEAGDDIADFFDKGNTVEDLNNLIISQRKNKFRFKTLQDSFNEPQIETKWIVENLLIQGGASLLIAKPKLGKTTWAQFLATCISSGVDFLGFKTIQGKVLFVAYEEHENEFKNKFRKMPNCNPENIFIHCGAAPENMHFEVEKLIMSERPCLVILDTLFKHLKTSDINDYSKVYPLLDPLLKMARKYDIHILTLHHSNKSHEGGTNSILGSTAIHGSFDNIIIIESSGNEKRTIATDPRYGTKIEKVTLHFNESECAFGLGEKALNHSLESLEKKVLEHLKISPEKNKIDEIKSELSCSKKNLTKALEYLTIKKMLGVTGEGFRGDPLTYRLI